jgi:hypothetical protein
VPKRFLAQTCCQETGFLGGIPSLDVFLVIEGKVKEKTKILFFNIFIYFKKRK